MRTINGILILALILAFTPIAAGQEAPDKVAEEKPERSVEPEAQKLIDAAKARLYSAAGTGLTEMTCVVSLYHPTLGAVPVKYSVKFTAPRTAAVELQPLPEELAAYAEVLEPQLKKQGSFVANMFGETCSGMFSDIEKYNLALKDETTDVVVQTRFASDAALEKSEVTFGENGLPTKMVHTTERGPVTITPTFTEKDGKFLLTKGKIVTPASSMELSMTHEKVGKFWLVSTVTMSTPTGPMKMKAEEIKVKPGE